jgi:hypothetical protein
LRKNHGMQIHAIFFILHIYSVTIYHPMSDFQYNNTEVKMEGGAKVVRKVVIRKSKGHKSVSIYSRNGSAKTAKRALTDDEIRKIRAKQFIPKLFTDCIDYRKKCKRAFAGKTYTKKRYVAIPKHTLAV